MAKTRGIREIVGSVVCLSAVTAALVAIDERVRARFWLLFGDATRGDLSPWGDRFSDLGGAVWAAARDQSIEHAPLVIFAVVGAVLVLFMLRT